MIYDAHVHQKTPNSDTLSPPESSLKTYDLTLVQINLAACFSAIKDHKAARECLERGRDFVQNEIFQR